MPLNKSCCRATLHLSVLFVFDRLSFIKMTFVWICLLHERLYIAISCLAESHGMKDTVTFQPGIKKHHIDYITLFLI